MRTEKNEIARLRKEAGLSRYRLAVMAGVTEKTIRNYEAEGVENARYGAVKRLAHALGVLMEDLEGDGDDGADER